jgi:hypothetical protein
MFSATATGTPQPAYQWWFNSAPLDGETNATLTLSNLMALPQGQHHRVEVVASNSFGVETNAFAALTIEPVSMGESMVTNDQFIVSFVGVAGSNYVLEYKANLTNPAPWTALATNVAGGGGELSFTNGPVSALTNRTYRVRLAE